MGSRRGRGGRVFVGVAVCAWEYAATRPCLVLFFAFFLSVLAFLLVVAYIGGRWPVGFGRPSGDKGVC